jgi:hypothetical protein
MDRTDVRKAVRNHPGTVPLRLLPDPDYHPAKQLYPYRLVANTCRFKAVVALLCRELGEKSMMFYVQEEGKKLMLTDSLLLDSLYRSYCDQEGFLTVYYSREFPLNLRCFNLGMVGAMAVAGAVLAVVFS